MFLCVWFTSDSNSEEEEEEAIIPKLFQSLCSVTSQKYDNATLFKVSHPLFFLSFHQLSVYFERFNARRPSGF